MRRKSKNNKLLVHPGLPHITVIVPVFNEERFIRKKIENIRASDYPMEKICILVVDNGSTDKTTEIVESMNVEVLRTMRGKVVAINEALRKVKTDCVVITDVDIIMDPAAIKILVQSLNDDVIAASAQIKIEDGHLFYFKSKKTYHDKDWRLRYFESLVDSCCSSDGRIMAFDRRVIDHYPEDALVDDFEMSFLVKQKGGRAILHPDAFGWEYCPINLYAELEQIARRTAIGILTAWRYRGFLFNKKYGDFGKLIFPVRRFLIFFLPIFILFQAFSVIYLFGFRGIAAIGLPALVMIAGRNVYPFIQFLGILKGYFDLLTGRVRTGGVWDRYKNT